MRFNCKINIRPVLLTLVEGLKTKKAKLFILTFIFYFYKDKGPKIAQQKQTFVKYRTLVSTEIVIMSKKMIKTY